MISRPSVSYRDRSSESVKRVSVYLRQSEYEVMKRQADKRKWSVSAFIASRILTYGVAIDPDDSLKIFREIAEVKRTVRGVGTNINQIARAANTYNDVTDVQLGLITSAMHEATALTDRLDVISQEIARFHSVLKGNREST